MKLELTNNEVREAVAQYVVNTIGIDLSHNDLSIVFSATRHEGLIAKLETTPKAKGAVSAAVTVSAPVAIPGFSDTAVDPTAVDAPALAEPVADPADVAVAEADTSASVVSSVAAEDIGTEGTIDLPTESKDEKPKTTATLFGKPASAA